MELVRRQFHLEKIKMVELATVKRASRQQEELLQQKIEFEKECVEREQARVAELQEAQRRQMKVGSFMANSFFET